MLWIKLVNLGTRRICDYAVQVSCDHRGGVQKTSLGGPNFCGCSCQLSLNKFFDPSTPMTKGCDGEKKQAQHGQISSGRFEIF